MGVAHFTSENATYALLAAPGSLPTAEAAAWIYSWAWVPGLGFIVFLPLLFPSGPALPEGTELHVPPGGLAWQLE